MRTLKHEISHLPKVILLVSRKAGPGILVCVVLPQPCLQNQDNLEKTWKSKQKYFGWRYLGLGGQRQYYCVPFELRFVFNSICSFSLSLKLK